ncbi:MAG: hypothetical protein ABIF92_01445 [archaeon]
MPKQALVEIKEAEHKADELVEKAHKEAEDILNNIKKTIEKDREEAFKKARQEADLLIAKTRDKASKDASGIVQSAKKQIESAEKKNETNIPAAVEIVVKHILGEE